MVPLLKGKFVRSRCVFAGDIVFSAGAQDGGLDIPLAYASLRGSPYALMASVLIRIIVDMGPRSMLQGKAD